MKARGLTPEVHLILQDLSMGGGSGIPGVEVKFVDIRRNTSGEGDFPGPILTLRREGVGSKQV